MTLRPHTPEELSGASFLHNQSGKLHTTPEVEHTRSQMREHLIKTTNSSPVLQKPAPKLASWMQILEKTHLSHRDQPEVMERLKRYYYKQHVITRDRIPEAAYLLEQRIARNMGYGDIELTNEFRDRKAQEIIEGQKSSLDQWFNYLTGPDALYPMWAKYWAFTSMLRLGKLEKKIVKDDQGAEKEIIKFQKRDATTVAPFPILNPRALALTIGAIEQRVAQKYGQNREKALDNTSAQLSEKEFTQLISTTNFGQIYAQFLKELPAYSTEGLKEVRGEWVRYPQHSSPDLLVNSLEGHPLEWCTANTNTARTQLEGGDFYVYYSWDQDGNATIPRLAIRMEMDTIAEVRGIAADQNLDPYITPILSQKLQEFPDGDHYLQKSADMKQLTEIEAKYLQGENLSNDDLRFLYEIDHHVQGFGYQTDPRIGEILSQRQPKKDLSTVLGCSEKQISISAQEAVQGSIIYHYGNLNLSSLTSTEGLTLPQTIGGDLDLSSLTSTEGLTLPQTIGGYLNLSSLTSTEGLTLPQTIGGSLNLSSLTSAEGLTLPQTIGGNLDFRRLTSAEGLTLPQTLRGNLYLSSLTSAEGLTLPQTIGKELDLNSLTSAEGLTLPQTIGKDLDLSSLTSAEGLTLPQTIGGNLDFRELTSAEGLTLPQTIGGNLDLNRLTSAEGLTLPQTIGGNLDLKRLTSAEGLTLPQIIGGNLDLNRLTSTEGLTLPQTIGGNLYLRGLTSAEGLTLPQTIGKDLYLSNLTSAEGLTLPQTLRGNLYLSSLTSAEGLTLPQTLKGATFVLTNLLDDVKKKYPQMNIQVVD